MIKYLKIEYFYLFIVLIWEPFQKFILKVDGAGYSMVIIGIIIIVKKLLTDGLFLKTAFSKPLYFYFLWVVYVIVNILINGIGFDTTFLSIVNLIAQPLLLMIIISIEYKKNSKSLLNVLIGGLYVFEILILIYDGLNTHGRFGDVFNSNTIGTTSTVLLLLLYLQFHKKNFKIYTLLLLAIIPLYIVVLSGSRTAFLGFSFLIVAHFFIHRSKSIFITILRIGLGVLILYLPFKLILNDTELGERLSNTTEQSENLKYREDDGLLSEFGDRGYYYYQGWVVFKEHPIMGVGLGNFIHHNPLEKNQHSEYMIQLSELGVIGFFLFVLFYFSIFKRLNRLRPKTIEEKREKELMIAYILIILAMITATRMFKVWYFFCIPGIVIAFINEKTGLYSKFINRKPVQNA